MLGWNCVLAEYVWFYFVSTSPNVLVYFLLFFVFPSVTVSLNHHFSQSTPSLFFSCLLSLVSGFSWFLFSSLLFPSLPLSSLLVPTFILCGCTMSQSVDVHSSCECTCGLMCVCVCVCVFVLYMCTVHVCVCRTHSRNSRKRPSWR